MVVTKPILNLSKIMNLTLTVMKRESRSFGMKKMRFLTHTTNLMSTRKEITKLKLCITRPFSLIDLIEEMILEGLAISNTFPFSGNKIN